VVAPSPPGDGAAELIISAVTGVAANIDDPAHRAPAISKAETSRLRHQG